MVAVFLDYIQVSSFVFCDCSTNIFVFLPVFLILSFIFPHSYSSLSQNVNVFLSPVRLSLVAPSLITWVLEPRSSVLMMPEYTLVLSSYTFPNITSNPNILIVLFTHCVYYYIIFLRYYNSSNIMSSY